MSNILREFVVTLKSRADLSAFYEEMENEGTYGHAPSRVVTCVAKRPSSRNTHYLLTEQEAENLRRDPKIQAVTLSLKDMGIKSQLHASQTAEWSRGDAIAVDQKNWGLYRASLGTNISGWGSDSASSSQTAEVNFTATGKNVDIIVLDEIAYPDHSEFGERFNQYDWFANHNLAVWPENPNSTYSYNNYSGTNNHATHVASIIAGETQGWARGANIYNLRHDTAGFTSNASDSSGSYTPSYYVIDYIREFHNSKSVNPETGRINPTIVNCSWSLGSRVDLTNPIALNGKSRFSKVYFRGQLTGAETLGESVTDTGYSGVCSTSSLVPGGRIVDLTNKINGGNRISTTSSTAATCTSLTKSIIGRASLTNLGIPIQGAFPGVDDYDDAYWTLTVPFAVTFLGGAYGSGGSPIHVSTNSFVMFGGSASDAAKWEVSGTNPNTRKIAISGGDRSCQRLYGGVEGTSPNRTYRVRWEGHDAANGGVDDDPTFVWEMTFYEATPTQIDLHIDTNSTYRAEFSLSQLQTNFGLMQTGFLAPYKDASIDADIADAINDGIIFVSAAGNGGFKLDTSTGDDYDNYFVDNGLELYYHRGATPSSSHPDMICVGALDSNSSETKTTISNTGPRVDLYAAGKNVIGAVYNNLGEPNGNTAGTVNDGSNILTGAISSVARSAGNATIVTTEAHDLINGDVVTVNCSNSSFNAYMVSVTVVNFNTFRYTNAGGDVSTTSATGDITVGYLYQKYNGTSMSAAQVTGVLALALETYPNMTQAEAKAYIINYAKNNLMTNTGGGFNDGSSLLDGNNRILFYYKERPDTGTVFPKINYKIRPSSGAVYPRVRRTYR